MELLKRWEIEGNSEQFTKAHALECFAVKGLDVYLFEDMNTAGAEYNCNIYLKGKLIKYLTYPDYVENIPHNLKAYKNYVIKCINKKVYALDELRTVGDYKDFTNKRDFIYNIYPQYFDSISVFDENASEKIKAGGYKYRAFTNVYKNKSDALAWIDARNILEKAYSNKLNDDKWLFDAVFNEMMNHESPIDWDGYQPALDALGIKETPKNTHIIQAAYKKACHAVDW